MVAKMTGSMVGVVLLVVVGHLPARTIFFFEE